MTESTVDAGDRAESDRPRSVIAGVIATAAGTAAVPQLLGLFSDVAQVADLARSQYLLVGSLVVAALGLIALFGPGHHDYRRSSVRVCFTVIAVLVSGAVAGVGIAEKVRGAPPSKKDTGVVAASASARAPSAGPSAPSRPASSAGPSPTGGNPADQVVPADPVDTVDPGPGPVPPTTPAPVPTRKPAPTVAALGATMACGGSCVTSEDIVALGGGLTGRLASGHRLMLFVEAPDGRYYPGSRGQVFDGGWSGKVHVGSANGTESSYSYVACVYDIDATFADWLDSRSFDQLNEGLTRVPATGSADSLACRRLTWNRP